MVFLSNERPPCFICGAPAYLVVGRRYMCGKCALKAQQMKQDKEEKEMLKDFSKEGIVPLVRKDGSVK